MRVSHPAVPAARVRGGLPVCSLPWLMGTEQLFWGEGKMLCPTCSSVLGVKLQYLLLSAVPSSPMPTPQALPTSPEPTAAARQLDELLADLGQMQSKVSCILGQAARGRLEPIPHLPHPSSWQRWGKEPERRQPLNTRWTTCWVA